MRILVTGASGFIGSLLMPALQADGHNIRAFGRDTERIRIALASARESNRGTRTAGHQTPPAEVVRGDALSGHGLAAAFPKETTQISAAFNCDNGIAASHLQGGFHCEGNRRADVDILRVGREAGCVDGHMIGIEWDIRETESARRVRGGRSLKPAYRVVDGDGCTGDDGAGRVRDNPGNIRGISRLRLRGEIKK